MAKVLTGERLFGVTECAVRPAAVLCLWEGIEMIASRESEHDGEGIGAEMLHDGVAKGGGGVLVNSFIG